MPSCKIDVHVRPNARRPGLEATESDSVRVRVTAAPENGKANDAVCAVLAKELGLAKSDVQIVAGHRARRKVVEIRLTKEEVFARITSLENG